MNDPALGSVYKLLVMQITVDRNKYFENVLSTLKASTQDNLNRLRQPVDKNK